MSSWERARHIPWSRIIHEGDDVGHQKERIFYELQQEALRQEREAVEETSLVGDISTPKSIPFQWSDLFKSAAFGGCIGSITGSVFGFLDGMRTATDSQVLKNASNMAKARYLVQGSSRSAMIFGSFFTGFHVLKYGVRVTMSPGDFSEIGIAGLVSMGALLSRPALRPSTPYASMLIIMDSVHLIMKHFQDD